MENIPIEKEISDQMTRGVLLVVTGPSGSGKDTLITLLKKKYPQIEWIVSTTSRKMRDGEEQGKPYHFKTREEFEELIAEGEFFEWVEFRGELYGTQKKTLMDALASGKDVVWKIEMKGVKNIKQKIKNMVSRSAFVYLIGDSLEVMKKRVHKAEGEEGAKVRWNESLVIWEMKQYEDCDYLLVNSDESLDQSVEKLSNILHAKRYEIIRES